MKIRLSQLTKHLSLLLFAILSCSLNAELKIASPFTKHMVLQRNSTVPVWGHSIPGSKISVKFSDQNLKTIANDDGAWRLNLAPLTASSQGQTMIISSSKSKQTIRINDVLVGDVWICSGQSNMNMGYQKIEDIKALKSIPANIRSFHVKNTVSFEEKAYCQGTWEKSPPPSAVAFSFAHFLEKSANIPIGIIQTSWGSSSIEAWMPRDMTATLPHFKTIMEEFDANTPAIERITATLKGPKPWNIQEDVFLRRQPNIVYNAIMHPLAPYACQGFVWYQGERQTKTMYGMPKEPWFARTSGMLDYGNVLQEWILRYRQEWENPELNFLIVMLPGYGNILNPKPGETPESPNAHSWAWIRESQLSALKLPHTNVVNTIDLGDLKDIHPIDKLPIGKRLALLALRETVYENIEAEGPTFKELEKHNNTLIIHFQNSTGLKTNDGATPTCFWIADESENWVRADAKIEDETIILSSPELVNPLYVRYAFAAKPTTNLTNNTNLPAYPFRTDTFNP